MTVIDNRNQHKTFFSELLSGDVFNFLGDLYMKAKEENDLNAVSITKGELTHVEDDAVVKEVVGSFVMTD